MAKNLNWRRPRRQRFQQYGVTGFTPKELIQKRKELEERKSYIELEKIEEEYK